MDSTFTVIAIISAFNEGDIISKVIRHLVENDIQVYLMDNHSTDDTIEQAEEWLGKGLLHIERFPQSFKESSKFDWTAILHRKAQLASELSADWFIHHDADEIREGPWPRLNLKEAIHWVDSLDYNCINFRVLNFPPIDDDFKTGDDPRSHFTHYEAAADFDKVQLKCWKSGVPISLARFGGHEVAFEGRRIFPIPFLLRHYPIRSQQHGVRKIFSERRSRFVESEREMGWHRQYDSISDTHCFLRDPRTLCRFDLNQVRFELQVPQTIRANFKTLAEHSSQYTAHLEQEMRELRQHLANVEEDREQLREHPALLERNLQELRQHVADVEHDRQHLRQHVADVEHDRQHLRQHVADVEHDRQHLRQHVAALEQVRSTLQREITELHASLLWRSSSILRRLFSTRNGHAAPYQRSLPNSPAVASCLDVPTETETTVVETCRIMGWTCSPNGIESVKIFLDGQQMQQFLPDIERPDVALVYPDVPGSAQSGFDITFHLGTVPEGIHQLQLLITDHAGNESCHCRSLRVRNQSLA